MFDEWCWLDGDSLAPYVGTPDELIGDALRLAGVASDDFVLDIGSGDGRIPIAATLEFGARAAGIEIDAELVQRSMANAREKGVDVAFIEADVTMEREDVRDSLASATLLTMFLLPEALQVLRPLIVAHLEGRHDRRVLCLGWSPKNLTPIKSATLGDHIVSLDAYVFDATSLSN